MAVTHGSLQGADPPKAADETVPTFDYLDEEGRRTAEDFTRHTLAQHGFAEAHLAGATVLRGPMGFGRHSRMHAAKLLDLSTDLPIVIEIVDSEERINAFLPVVDELVSEGLVTLEAVRVLKYAAVPRTR